MAALKPKTPELIFFQEIKEGDVRKQQAISNDSDSGGGARDLRIRPADKFIPILTTMFPNESDEVEVRRGYVYWLDNKQEAEGAVIELWRPTEARPGEARLGKIHLIDSWKVNLDEYRADLGKGKKWFFLLVKDIDGVVWARLLYETNLPNEDVRVRQYVQERIRETNPRKAVRGTLNFKTGERYP